MDSAKKKDFVLGTSDTSATVGDGGGRAGPTRPLASYREVELVGNQAKPPNSTTGRKMSEHDRMDHNPFEKRGLQRTPPKTALSCDGARRHSTGNLNTEDTETKCGKPAQMKGHETTDNSSNTVPQSSMMEGGGTSGRQPNKKQRLVFGEDTPAREQKRKREETPKKQKTTEQKQFIKVLKDLTQHIKNLQQVVESGYKVKNEIKEATGRLVYCMDILAKDDMKEWVENVTKTPPRDEERAVEETEESNADNDRPASTATREMSTQTEEIQRRKKKTTPIDDEISRIVEQNSSNTNMGEIRQLTQEKWPEECYTASKILNGRVIQAAKEKDLMVIIDKDVQDKHPLMKRLCETHPHIGNMMKKTVQPGKLVYAANYGKIMNEEGVTEISSHLIYLAGIEGAEIVEDDVGNIIDALNKVKSISSKEGRKELIITCVKDTMETLLRKAIELVFRGEDYEILLAIKRGKKPANTPEGQLEREKEWQAQKTNRQRPRRQTMIVKPTKEGKTYAELLSEMKKEEDTDKLDVRISNVERTKEGYVKLNFYEAKKGSGDDFRAAMQEKMKDIGEVQLKKRKRNIVLLDLDDITTAEEVKEAVKAELQKNEMREEELTIKMSQKPNNRGLQYANIQLPLEDANALLQKQRMKVGWVRCRVIERLAPIKCFKCQKYGHFAKECKSVEDMTGRCLRCGELGQVIKDCKNEAYCRACEKRGHLPNEMACPEYKKLMNEIRRKKGVDRKHNVNKDIAS